MTSTAILHDALAAHQAGRLDEAEKLYLQAVDGLPDNADAWHLLGCVRHAQGALDEATENIDHALALDPKFAEAMNSLGNVWKDRGNLVEAGGWYNRALAARPDFAEALANLSDIRRLSGDLTGALEAGHEAATMNPRLAAAQNNIGAALLDRKDSEEALVYFDRALELDPAFANAQINRVQGLGQLERLDEAMEAANQAVEQFPKHAAAFNARGIIKLATGALEDAETSFEQAIALDATFADAHNNLALVRTRLGRPAEALPSFQAALAMKPGNPTWLANTGGAFQAMNQLDDAFRCFDEALRLQPSHAEARWNRAIALLLTGQLKEGFVDYEARWQLPEFNRFPDGPPLWTGGAMTGRSVLLRSEQGYGDTIQMLRYADTLTQMGVQVSVETHAPLTRLAATAPGVHEVIERGAALPDVKYQAPMMSLPYFCATLAGSVPANIPYLSAPKRKPGDFGISGRGTKVGLVWAGRPTHKNDRNRSLSLEMLGSMLEISGIDFYSLQVGERGADIEAAGLGDRINDLAPYLNDFADTAAALMHLDLVVAVDTAVAHLAGALGRPAWVMLPFAPDWRWGLETSESPWYPSLKLYRQPAIGDWESVVTSITTDLAKL